MGVDEGVHLKTDEALDSFAIANALAEEIKTLGCELIFMGKQSVDYDSGIVGQLTAELLGYNSISVCVTFQLEGTTITAQREIEGGKEIVETSLPCIITAQKGLNEPRYASLKGIMAAKKKVIHEKPVPSVPALVENLQLKMPTPKNPGRILGTDSSAVPELVKLLHEEAKVI